MSDFKYQHSGSQEVTGTLTGVNFASTGINECVFMFQLKRQLGSSKQTIFWLKRGRTSDVNYYLTCLTKEFTVKGVVVKEEEKDGIPSLFLFEDTYFCDRWGKRA